MRLPHSLLVVGSLLLLTLTGISQEVPPGVNYKPASEALNAKATANLEAALKGGSEFPANLLPETFTCGPMLWKDLRPSADKVLLESKVIDGFVGTPAPAHVELRAFTTEQQRRSFWTGLLAKYPRLKTATVRKATPDEIRYYWATIPFDIEAPLFAIDDGAEVFITNFAGKPTLFWIDLVGDLKTLR